ncbi:uncharacterized protein V6R79_010282 [Siganus canaliculatus]
MAGVLLLLPPPPSPPPAAAAPPRPPQGEESLSRHGGDFRAASSGWMTLSRKCTQPSSSSSSSSPCPVLSRAPASCSARCCAPTLKSRRNPVRLSAAAAPEPQGAGGGRRKVPSPLDRIGPQWLFLLVPTGEPKLVYLTGKSQPTKLDKQRDLRLRKNTAQNKLLFLPAGRPVSASESAPPVCHRLAGPGGGAPTNSGAPMTEPQEELPVQ